jgi:hypothetical protein
MLEKGKFSLARAGVMAGLVGIVFLGAGFFSQYESAVPKNKVHLPENLWSSIERLLIHVQVSSSNNNLTKNVARCASGALGHERLLGRVQVFNQQLEQLQQRGFVKQLYQLDVNAWLHEPNIRNLSCAEAGTPLQWLLSRTRESGSSFLETLEWKERQTSLRQTRFSSGAQVLISQQSLSSRSPWQGIPGCVFWTDALTGQPLLGKLGAADAGAFCDAQFQSIKQQPSKSVEMPLMPSLAQVLDPLSGLRLPQSSIYQRLVGERNQTLIKGQTQPVGMHSQLTIDPLWQNKLQLISQCFTGSDAVQCKAMEVGGADRYENARVRMAGMAVLDIPSGRLVVAASASTPCFEHDKSRTGPTPKNCPTISDGNVHRPRVPQAVNNHAMFTQAPPGSLVKPILMAGILRSPLPPSSLTGLDKALQRSDSQQFLDAMLCRKQLGSGLFSSDCERPQLILQSIHQLGWNAGCDGKQDWQRSRCGMIDLLHGSALAEAPTSVDVRLLDANLYRPLQFPVLAGQLMVETMPDQVSGWQDMKISGQLPSPEQRLLCAQSGRKGYVRCSGGRMALVSEGYGQGNAMTTPVGVAGMLGALAGSSRGLQVRYPHLVENFWTSDGRLDEVNQHGAGRRGLAMGPEGLTPEVSRKILDAMETTHVLGGTAHAACKKVLGEKTCLNSIGVAGKTGTPGDADERSLQQLMRDQALHSECLAQGKKRCQESHPLPRPRFRWYAAVFKSAGSEHYDKAIAVLVHSNWRISDGRYADDNNAASEMAFHAIKQVREMRAMQ